MKVPVKHMRCGETAFLYESAKIRAHEPIEAEFAMHVDGRPLDADKAIRCDHCGWIIYDAVELYPLKQLGEPADREGADRQHEERGVD